MWAAKLPGEGAALYDAARALTDLLLELGIAIDGGSERVTAQRAPRHIAGLRAKPKDGPNLWRRYMVAVKQQAIHLARAGKIDIVRKGKAVDPNDFKGIVRLRLTEPGA